MKLYKLTDENGKTHGGTQWAAGVTHGAQERMSNPTLCTSDVIHAYADPDLALLMNPTHASFSQPRLWEAEGEPCVQQADKLGCYSLTTTRELVLPSWYQDDKMRVRVRVRFAVLAARAVLDIFEVVRPDDDRPRKAIEAAEAYLSGGTASAYAAWAASAAASAASSASYAASAAAYAAWAASAAASASYAASAAAYAAWAASAARAKLTSLDLVALAREAVKLESFSVQHEMGKLAGEEARRVDAASEETTS